MGARQINEFDRALLGFELANVAFHGDTWIVADALPEAGQAVEQRTLAGVRAADNRDACICIAASRDIFQEYAGFSAFGFSHYCRASR
jgi:hypothetical protein